MKQDLKIGGERAEDGICQNIDMIIGSDIVYLAKQFDDLI
jgi:hypothetical protein